MSKNILIVLSVLLNIILIVYYFNLKTEESTNDSLIKSVNKQRTEHDFDIRSSVNFSSVFIEQNDSIYNRIWSKAFENEPEMAFLISCSYYFCKNDAESLKNIEVSKEQIKAIYNDSIKMSK